MEFKVPRNPALKLIAPRFERAVYNGKPAWASPRADVFVDINEKVLMGRDAFPGDRAFFHGDIPVMVDREAAAHMTQKCVIQLVGNHPATFGPGIAVMPLDPIAKYTLRRMQVYQALMGNDPLCIEDNKTLFEVALKHMPKGILSVLMPALFKRPGKPPLDVQPYLTVKIDEDFKMGQEKYPDGFVIGNIAARVGAVPSGSGQTMLGQLVLYPQK